MASESSPSTEGSASGSVNAVLLSFSDSNLPERVQRLETLIEFLQAEVARLEKQLEDEKRRSSTLKWRIVQFALGVAAIAASVATALVVA